LGEKGDKSFARFGSVYYGLLVYWFIQVISSWFIESLLKVYWFMFLGFANKLFGFRIARFPGTGSRNAGLCSAGLVRLRQL